MRSVVNDGVVRQVGGHQQRVYVFGLEALHVSLGEVRVQVPRDVVVPRGELEARGQVAYTLVGCWHGGQDWGVVARAVSEYWAGTGIKDIVNTTFYLSVV